MKTLSASNNAHLFQISHNAPVEGSWSPQAKCGIKRLSVLTSAYPCCHEDRNDSPLHIPNVYHDGQEVAREECAKGSSAEMSDRFAHPIPSHFPAAHDPCTATTWPLNSFNVLSAHTEAWPWAGEGFSGSSMWWWKGFQAQETKLGREILDRGLWIEA